MPKINLLFCIIIFLFSEIFPQDIKILTQESGTQKISDVIKFNDDNYFLLYNELLANGFTRLKFKYFNQQNSSGYVESKYVIPEVFSNQTYAKAIRVKQNMILVAWIDGRREKFGDIYLQLIDASGILWDSSGICITSTSSKKSNLTLASDNAGNIFIAWNESKDGFNKNVFIQKLNLFGEELWKQFGIQVFSNKGIYDNPYIASDEEGGFYLGYTDKNSLTNQVYIQRFSSEGSKLFGQFGKFVSDPRITSDFVSIFFIKNFGLVAFWTSFEKFQKIYSQKISDKGFEEWSEGGEEISQVEANQTEPKYYFQNDSFVILFKINNGIEKSVFIQKLGLDGLPDFSYRGYKVCSFTNDSISPAFIKYQNNYLVYFMDRKEVNLKFSLFGQLLSQDGLFIWKEAITKIIDMDFDDLFNLEIFSKNSELFAVIERYFGTSINIFQVNFGFEQSFKLSNNVKISPLDLVAEGNSVRLWWVSEQETGNFQMWLERRYENENWKEVANILSNEATDKKFHSFEDKLFLNGSYEYRLKYIASDGRILFSEPKKLNINTQSDEKNLLQNSPNPFNNSTKITFKLSEPSNVKITIFNSRAEEIIELLRGYYSAGSHEVIFNAPENLASGIYFYKIESKNFVDVKKMVYTK